MNKIQNFAQSCLNGFAVADVIGQFKKFVGAGKGAEMAPKCLDRPYWIFKLHKFQIF